MDPVSGYRSEGLALTGYDIPGCVEDGAWMLWENSSVAVAAVAAVAHQDLGNGQLSVLLRLRRFWDARIDPSRLPSAEGYTKNILISLNEIKYKKIVNKKNRKRQKTA